MCTLLLLAGLTRRNAEAASLTNSFAQKSQTNDERAASQTAAARARSTNYFASNVVLQTSNSPALALTQPGPLMARFIPRPPRNAYEAQLALARQGISPGCLDGVIGPQTRAALSAFQAKENLPMTGQLDPATQARMLLSERPDKIYLVTSNDLARLHAVGTTWLAKSLQKRLDYENILELLAEKGWAHPNLVRLLNPAINWTNVAPGTLVTLPNVESPAVRVKAAVVRIRLAEKILEAFDETNALLAHFPCSIARQIEKRPLGELFVEGVALNPTYRFDPEIFPESVEARKLGRVLLLPPGPNNPVGTAWIGLNRPGYGIHGTPHPEDIGRTESHGCFRLANWNAEYLAQLVRIGTRVIVEP